MPYAKKTRETLRNLIIILTILPLLTFGQKEKRKSVETYMKSDRNFYYRLDLFSDSTFKYEHSFELGSATSEGNWTVSNDTLMLNKYETPYKITKVVEKKIDTLLNSVIIKVVVDSLAALPFIDGVQIRKNNEHKQLMPLGLVLWVNDDCKTKATINEFGEVNYEKTDIFQISLNYDKYTVIEKSNNFFIIEISTFPIWTSPPTLMWTRWVINKREIRPIECGQTLEHLTLNRK
jgi:hypothetical protein